QLTADRRTRYDAVVVGSGPNGFAAAITIARAGRTVLLVEGADTLGGSTRSAELTLPGFVHDVCASVMALLPTSPFFAPQLSELATHGLELLTPEVPFAHPFEDGTAAVAHRTVDATADGLGAD